VRALLTAARKLGMDVVTSAPVVGQVWRDGRRQALVARLLAGTRVHAPDEVAARAAGEALAATRTSDVVDALLAVLTQDGDTVLTSDPGDLERLLTARRMRANIASC
jgi:hypothetical protein